MDEVKKFKHKCRMPVDDVVVFCQELASNIKKGTIGLSADHQAVTFDTAEELEVSIKARGKYDQGKDREDTHIKIKFQWKKHRTAASAEQPD